MKTKTRHDCLGQNHLLKQMISLLIVILDHLMIKILGHRSYFDHFMMANLEESISDHEHSSDRSFFLVFKSLFGPFKLVDLLKQYDDNFH